MSAEMRDRILDKLVSLQDATRTFGKVTDDALELYVDALTPYGSVALMAISAWPLQSSDWPTVKELVDATKECAAELRSQSAASSYGSRETPVQKLLNAVHKSPRGGPQYVASWFDAAVNCQFGESVIHTTGFGVEHLTPRWKEMLKQFGVRLEHDTLQDDRLTLHVDALRADGKLGRQKWKQ